MTTTPRRVLLVETVIVVMIAVGLAGLRAAWLLVAAVTAAAPLASQSTSLNASRAPGRPWIDLGFQLISALALLLPALLALHLVTRDGGRLRDIGLSRDRLGRKVLAGLAIAAAVGGAGLALYLGSRALGTSLEVRPSGLPDVWWRYPVLILSAVANAVLEEVVVLGYLLRRLEQLGVGRWPAAVISASVRGAYHLYQGLAGFVGNFVMGLLFAWGFQRYRTIVPMIVAHAVIDIVAFAGYALLADRVSWL